MLNEMIGKNVIVRGDRSGVFFGTLAEKQGQEVVMINKSQNSKRNTQEVRNDQNRESLL